MGARGEWMCRPCEEALGPLQLWWLWPAGRGWPAWVAVPEAQGAGGLEGPATLLGQAAWVLWSLSPRGFLTAGAACPHPPGRMDQTQVLPAGPSEP